MNKSTNYGFIRKLLELTQAALRIVLLILEILRRLLEL